MKRILIAGAIVAGLLGLAGTPADAAPAKPAVLIKKAGGKFKGNNIYSQGDDDVQQLCSQVGNEHTFTLKVQNDGTTKRRFNVTTTSFGGSGSSTFTVIYKGEDVTTAIIAGPGKRTNKLAPGERSKPFKIVG